MVEFIAEAGQTMRGDIGCAVEMVDAFAEVGADYFKVQMVDPETIATADAISYWKTGPSVGQREQFALNGVIPHDKWGPVRAACDDNAIGFVATPFDLEAVWALRDLDPAAVKIASGDITFIPLLRAVKKAFPEKPIFLSTGASTGSEIAAAVSELAPFSRITPLACALSYPCPLPLAALGRIRAIASILSSKWSFKVGYSDHTVQEFTALYAVLAGADLLEKHVTFHRDDPQVPDDRMGLTPEAFGAYVHYGKEGAKIRHPELATIEEPARSGARRAARWAVNFPPDTAIVGERAFTFLRPDPDADGRSIRCAESALAGRWITRRFCTAGEIVRLSDFVS